MTTTTTRRTGGSGLTFGGVLRSEAIKLTSLRSTAWCYGIIVAITLGLGLLLAATFNTGGSAGTHEMQQSLWVQAATLGILFSQLVAAVLGALMITGEYGTGMIRSTITAVPKRVPALVAKAVVFAIVTFVVGLIAIVGTALVTTPILAGNGIQADFSDSKTWFAFLGGAGYLALVGLIALFLGTIIRNSAGGISAALGLVFVAPIVMQIFAAVTRAAWAENVLAFLPSSAGGRMYSYLTETAPAVKGVVVLDPLQGLLVVAAWVIVLFAFAVTLLKSRDA